MLFYIYLIVFSIMPIMLFKKINFINRNINLFNFLSLSLKNGFSIIESLNIYIQNTKSYFFKKKLKTIVNSLSSGEKFSDAIKRTNLLKKDEYYTLLVYEKANIIEEFFKNYKNSVKILKMNNFLITFKELIYIVLSFNFVFILFYKLFLVPVIGSIFKSFNIENSLNDMVNTILYVIVGYVILDILYYSLKNIPSLNIYPKYLKLMNSYNFLNSYYVLKKSGFKELDIFNFIKLKEKNKSIKKSYKFIFDKIENGETLRTALKNIPFFDEKLYLRFPNPNSRNYTQNIYELAQEYKMAFKDRISLITNIVIPILTIFTGAVVYFLSSAFFELLNKIY